MSGAEKVFVLSAPSPLGELSASYRVGATMDIGSIDKKSLHWLAVVFGTMAILIIAALAIVPHTRQQADRPKWLPGDFWIFEFADERLGRVRIPTFGDIIPASISELVILDETIVEEVPVYVAARRHTTARGPIVEVVSIDRDTLSTYLGLELLEAGHRTQEFSFPLAMGRNWTVNPGWDAEIPAQERVDLPRGTVSAFRIRYVNADASWDVWYSDEVNYMVQMETDDFVMVLSDWGNRDVDDQIAEIMADLARMARIELGATLWQLDQLGQLGIAPDRTRELRAQLMRQGAIDLSNKQSKRSRFP